MLKIKNIDSLSTKQILFIILTITLVVKGSVFIIALPYGSDLPPMYPDLEPYEDFKFLYLKEANNFLAGELPYKDFFHAYPPLFLYLLSSFLFLNIASWLPALPLIIFDILTVIPISENNLSL